MLDGNSVGFELFFKDNLTGPLSQATQKGAASLRGLENAKAGLNKQGGGLTGSLGGITSGIGAMLGPAALATAGVAALGAGLKQVISTGMDFTKTMSNVKALLGANADEFKRLNDTAISLGASTVFSSSQVADAMVNAAMAGQSTEEIIKSMPGYLNVAAAANLGLADAVEIGLSTLHQFNLSADKSIDVADQLTYTTTKSATSMQDLAEGLKYLGPTASALRIPLSEVLAAQGILANNGLRGSMATRALSTGFQRLAAPTSQMAKEMDRLNLNFFDTEGKFIGIADMVQMLQARMEGFTDKQKASTIATIFGNDAYQEMSILLSKGAGELRSFADDIANSQGTAAKVAKTQLDNLSGDMEELGGAWESLQLKIFSQSEGGFRSLVQMATTFLSRLGDAWEYITKPLQEVKTLFGELWTAVSDLFQALGLVGGEVDGLSYYFEYLRFTLEMSTAGLRAFLYILTSIINGIRTAVDYVASFWDALKNLAGNIAKVFLPVAELLQGVFTLNWEKVKSGFTGLKSGLSGVLSDAGTTFSESLNARRNRSTSTNDSASTDNVLTPAMAGGGNVNSSTLAPTSFANSDTKVKGGDIDVVGGKGSGKSVTVTINNLVNTLSVSGANMAQNIQEEIAKALTNAVRDFEQSYN